MTPPAQRLVVRRFPEQRIARPGNLDNVIQHRTRLDKALGFTRHAQRMLRQKPRSIPLPPASVPSGRCGASVVVLLLRSLRAARRTPPALVVQDDARRVGTGPQGSLGHTRTVPVATGTRLESEHIGRYRHRLHLNPHNALPGRLSSPVAAVFPPPTTANGAHSAASTRPKKLRRFITATLRELWVFPTTTRSQ